MVTAAFLAAALQAAAPAPAVPICSLVTPRGDSVGFSLRATADPDEIRLVSAAGSAWPAHSVVGRRRGAGFAIGGSGGLLLELGAPSAAQRSATLSRRIGQGASLPVAYGFCEERPASAAVDEEPHAAGNETGAAHPAFDPARWPQDCGLMLSDGRRLRFDFTLVEGGRVRLEGPQLWSGRPVSMSIRWMNGTGIQTGTFGRRGGPEGTQTMVVQAAQAVKLIRFRQIGEPSAPGLGGYGICGYTNIVRRPGS